MFGIKQIVLSVLAIFTTACMAFSQTYTITPNDTVIRDGLLEDMSTMIIQQVNTTSNSIKLKWQKLSENVPANWEASVCDNQFCYATLIDSGTMNPVLAGEYGLLYLKITPHQNYGTSIVKYIVWDIVNPEWKDTLTYILKVVETSGINNTENKNPFHIFPNPASDNMTIITSFSSGFEFFITDVSGKEILKGDSKTKINSVSTKDFPNGVYNISIIEKNKKIGSTNFIVQH